MTDPARVSAWPVDTATTLDAAMDTLVIDLRERRNTDKPQADLRDLARWCVSELAARTNRPKPLAIIVRHHRSNSGRTSDSLFGEVALNATRGFFRQLRYDRNWLPIPLSFVDAGDAADVELRALVDGLASGPSRVEVDKSSGETVAAHWKHKEGL